MIQNASDTIFYKPIQTKRYLRAKTIYPAHNHLVCKRTLNRLAKLIRG